jgi:hypothetical protein
MSYKRTDPEKTGQKNNSGVTRESHSVNDDSQHPALYLQRKAGNQAALQLLRSPGGHIGVQKKCGGCGHCQECGEEEESIQRKQSDSTSSPLIQGQGEEREAAEAAMAGLIVDDSANQLEPGQMRKSEFLAQLHGSVCAAAEEALAGTMWSAMGCPYIDRWFGHYAGQSSQHIERSLHKYAPEAAGAGSAADYITIVTHRVRQGIGQWRQTGEVTGLPEELASGGMAPEVSAGSLISGLVGGAVSAVGNAVSGLVSGVGNAISGMGQALFKGREGGAREAENPAAIRSQLGSGQSLDGEVRAGMEAAFGTDFSGVRIHSDANAQELNDGMNARAFTVGNDVAFGAGEYQPGTPVGDALIAHELAHVVQQGGANSSAGPMQKAGGETSALEEEADSAAVGAMVSMWGGAKGELTSIGRKAGPNLRAGLRLQRCGGGKKEATDQGKAAEGQPARLIDHPKIRSYMAQMWDYSTGNALALQEYSITVIRKSATGEITKVISQKGPIISQGNIGYTKICLPAAEKLQPGEEVWGTIHTHPLPPMEGIQEPNPQDQEIVTNADPSQCGTEQYVIARDQIWQFDGKKYWPVGDRKEMLGK